MPSSATSRSSRLRKYQVIYEECLKKEKSKKIESDKPSRSRRVKSEHIEDKPSRSRRVKSEHIEDKHLTTSKKTLNPYQIFVRDESKKSKYNGLPVQERMSTVAKEWKKSKDNKK